MTYSSPARSARRANFEGLTMPKTRSRRRSLPARRSANRFGCPSVEAPRANDVAVGGRGDLGIAEQPQAAPVAEPAAGPARAARVADERELFEADRVLVLPLLD